MVRFVTGDGWTANVAILHAMTCALARRLSSAVRNRAVAQGTRRLWSDPITVKTKVSL